MAVNILIADDHPVIRLGLKRILDAEPDMSVVAEAGDGDEALRLARSTDWDVALFDYSMPGCCGLDLLGHMRHEFPQRPVLMLSVRAEDVHARHVLGAGGAGYLSKERAPDELTRAIKTVAAGGQYVSPMEAERLTWSHSADVDDPLHERLSDREYRVMWLIGSGKRIGDIARELDLQCNTVAACRGRVLRKLGLHTTAELVRYALLHELVV